MSWTEERVELLKKMWSEGQSASQIAKELGGVTRNAVIGKVHRLGLSNRAGAGNAGPAKAETKPAKPSKPETKAKPAAKAEPKPAEAEEVEAETAPAPQPAAAAPQPQASRKAVVPAGQPLPPQPSANEISPEALARVSEVEKKARKLTLMELTERTCKWPVGDPATENFWFCGLPVQPGKPYCEAHVGVAFQPMSSRRDRRR
jgi:GcrA cell cycle regulator